MEGMRNNVIEIVGPYIPNKGDSLMMHAIVQKLGHNFYLSIDRRAYIPSYISRLMYDFASLALSQIRSGLGTVKPNEVNTILDCSGFMYSDQWESSSANMEKRREKYARLKDRGKKLIMLPQSFGPFQEERIRTIFSRILDIADLVFARDRISYQHILDLGCKSSHVKVAPDITILVPGEVPEDVCDWSSCVCIVPNYRMIDKTPYEVNSSYLCFLSDCIYKLTQKGLNPCIVLHEKHDYKLALSLQSSVGGKILIIDEDPIRTKGILGRCFAVISSRYHALVGALSQGTPALGTTWSHKYTTLFEEYDCPECLFTSIDSANEIDEKLSLITDASNRLVLIDKLKNGALRHKEQSAAMWKEVEHLLFR